MEVFEELLEAGIGEWVVEHAEDAAEGAGDDIGAGFGGLDDVTGSTDGGCQDVGVVVLNGEYFGNLADEGHAVPIGVIDATDEWGYEVGTGLCSEYGLRCGKYEGAVGANTLFRKMTKCLDAIFNHWDFDNDVVGNFG